MDLQCCDSVKLSSVGSRISQWGREGGFRPRDGLRLFLAIFPIKIDENEVISLRNPLNPPTLIKNFVACIFRHGARSWRRRLRSMRNSACSSTACSSGTVPPTHLSDKIFTTQTVSSFYSATNTCKTKCYCSDSAYK